MGLMGIWTGGGVEGASLIPCAESVEDVQCASVPEGNGLGLMLDA